MALRTPVHELTSDQLECWDLLAEIFGGRHNMHGKLKEAGFGVVFTFASDGRLATFDMNRLTTAVFLAHDRGIRLEISPASPRHLRIYAHKRQRTGSISQRHPTLEQALAMHRRQYPEEAVYATP